MAPDFNTLLATAVINEQKTLSYRNVSRALKVHVNAAKCMLYEFHQRENKKRPGSVYATYLISGLKKNSIITVTTKESVPVPNGSEAPVKIDGDEDTEMAMPSSPPPFPSSMPSVSFAASQKVEQAALPERLQVPIRTVSLAREEDLEKVRAQYEKITSIHVYSLSPGRLPDLQVLTDTSRALFSDVFVKEDPLIHNKNYGVIQNPHVRRRSGKRPANIEMPVAKVVQPTTTTAAKPAASNKTTTTKEEGSRPNSRESASTQDSKGAKPNLKRDDSSLFKAFAKQSAKPKLDRKDSGSGADSDTKMLENADEGESEDEALFLDTNTRKEGKKRSSDVTREREERQAKLRKMMEDDEAEVKAVPNVEEAAGLKSEAPAEEMDDKDEEGDGEVAWSDSDSEGKAKKAHAEQEQAQPVKRRGRRKVVKKRQTKDEDGYLVTREEEVWESFSEDESSNPQPKPKLAPPAKSQPKSSAASTAKSGGAQGAKKKGDIMSFFGKK